MRLIFLTSKTYPATTANHISTRELSKGFTKILGNNFILTTMGQKANELQQINTYEFFSFSNKQKRFKLLTLFIQLPIFINKQHLYESDTWFYSNDHYLSLCLLFFRKLFFCKYKICSDWHLAPNKKILGFVARHSDALVATTNHLKQIMVKNYGLKEGNVLVAYGGFDAEVFLMAHENSSKHKIRRQLNLPGSDFLVGYVGFFRSLGMDKGLEYMLESLTYINDPSVKTVFVGGKQKEIKEYIDLSKKLGVEQRAIVLPSIDSDLVPLYELAMDILVIPYPDKPHFRDHGLPLKVYEYMASNVPIVYSELSVISEVLSDYGYSFKASQSHDLSEKIQYVKNHMEEANSLASKAKSFSAQFSWESKAKNIIFFLTQR